MKLVLPFLLKKSYEFRIIFLSVLGSFYLFIQRNPILYVKREEKGGYLFSSVCSGTVLGLQSYLIQVEVDVSSGLPCFVMVGSLGGEVRESAERVRIALKNTGISLPPMHVSINLSPADIHKAGTGFDLPVAIGLLKALGKLKNTIVDKTFVIGELGLDGEVKPVTGILPLVWEAFRKGMRYCMVPAENFKEAALVEGIYVAGVHSLQEAVELFQMEEDMLQKRIQADTKQQQGRGVFKSSDDSMDFSDICGQEVLKRGAMISAAGFHHMVIAGPPGAGKTMVARRMETILPEMSYEESMEVTSIYSIAGKLSRENPLMQKRPFLSPHHTVTERALSGGGRFPIPGLVSLAHHGVLFLDEMPEFQRHTIDLLRQPLEEKKISIARSTGTFTYPADFMLIGAMNLCPCGYYPDQNKCTCTPYERHQYLSHLSGPILDRIDLCLEARKIEISQLQQKRKGISSKEMRERVLVARKRQERRYQGYKINFNSELKGKEFEQFCRLENAEKELAAHIYEQMQLSARAYHRMLRVARTIADLEDSEKIKTEHLTEAMCYRTTGILGKESKIEK